MTLQLSLNNFERLFFDGYPFPDDLELMAILLRMPDVKSQELFQKFHNECVKEVFDYCVLDPHWREFIKLLKAIRGLSGLKLQINRFEQCKAILLYYSYLFSGQSLNAQHQYSDAVTLKKKFDFFLSADSNNPKWGKSIDESRLERYPKFVAARNYYQAAGESIKNLAQGDLAVRVLFEKLVEVHYQSAKTTNQYFQAEKQHLSHTVSCGFCGAFFEFEPKPGRSKPPPHCGKSNCVRHYERLKQSRNYVAKTPLEWQPISPKKRRCVGGCGMQRQLNSDRVCRECFRKKPA